MGEVLEQLSALGVDPRGTTGLTDVQFRAAMAQLSSRRAALRAELSADEAVCIDRIRHKLTTHIEQVDAQNTLLNACMHASQQIYCHRHTRARPSSAVERSAGNHCRPKR